MVASSCITLNVTYFVDFNAVEVKVGASQVSVPCVLQLPFIRWEVVKKRGLPASPSPPARLTPLSGSQDNIINSRGN